MKKPIFFILQFLIGINVPAGEQSPCPNFSGNYFCTFPNHQYSPLKIEQWTRQNQKGVTYYRFDYTAIPGQAEVSKASVNGERDQMGWITRCKKDRLISIPNDGSSMQEIYLDGGHAITFTLNGKITLVCPGKSRSLRNPDHLATAI